MNFESIELNLIKRLPNVLCLFIATTGILYAHDGHHISKAWEACEEKKLSDACSYTLQQNKQYNGTCRAVAEALICVRNQPIEKLKDIQTITKIVKKTPSN
jgi:hypothetical protein